MVPIGLNILKRVGEFTREPPFGPSSG